MPDARCPMPDARCPMPDARCPMPDAHRQFGKAELLEAKNSSREHFRSDQ